MDIENAEFNSKFKIQENKAEIEKLKLEIKNYKKNIEDLLQENYCLNKKLDQLGDLVKNYKDDQEAILNECEVKNEKLLRESEETYQKNVNRYQQEIAELQNSLEESQNNVLISSREIETLLTQLQDLRSTIELLQTESKLKINYANIQKDQTIEEAKEQIIILERSSKKINQENYSLSNDISNLTEQLKEKEIEIEALNCKLVSSLNQKEKLQEEIQELKIEIDIMTIQSNQIQTKGNSLFSEVEDRRVMVEKQLLSMRIENNALATELKTSKSNLLQTKMAQLNISDFGMCENDKIRINELTLELRKYHNQNMELLRQIEQNEKKSRIDEQINNNYEFYHFSRLTKEKECEEAQIKLRQSQYEIMQERDKGLKHSTELYVLKQDLSKACKEISKLEIKLEEVKNEYSENGQKSNCIPNISIYQKNHSADIPIKIASEDSLNSCNSILKESNPLKSHLLQNNLSERKNIYSIKEKENTKVKVNLFDELNTFKVNDDKCNFESDKKEINLEVSLEHDINHLTILSSGKTKSSSVEYKNSKVNQNVDKQNTNSFKEKDTFYDPNKLINSPCSYNKLKKKIIQQSGKVISVPNKDASDSVFDLNGNAEYPEKCNQM